MVIHTRKTKNMFQMKQKLWIVFMLACVATSTVVSYSCWLALRLVHYHRRWSNWIRRHGKLILILDANQKKRGDQFAK